MTKPKNEQTPGHKALPRWSERHHLLARIQELERELADEKARSSKERRDLAATAVELAAMLADIRLGKRFGMVTKGEGEDYILDRQGMP